MVLSLVSLGFWIWCVGLIWFVVDYAVLVAVIGFDQFCVLSGLFWLS